MDKKWSSFLVLQFFSKIVNYEECFNDHNKLRCNKRITEWEHGTLKHMHLKVVICNYIIILIV